MTFFGKFTKSLATGVAFSMLATSVLGCSTFASHGEANLYRRIRTSPASNERMAALAEYATNYPSGVWITEVSAERQSNEAQVWAANNQSIDGLAFYMAAYPDGTYVEQARARQAALQTVTQGREQAVEHQEEHAEQTAAQVAEERRQWVTRAAQFWARTLIGVRNYGAPIAQVARANPDFSRAFGQAPAPQCTADRCIKHYHAHYAIPVVGGNRIEREMHIVLRVLLNGGRVNRVEVLFPNHGFSRWFELENRTSVLDEDPEARMAAIEWALARLEPVIAEVATGARAIDLVPEPIAPFGEAAPLESGEADTATDASGEAPVENGTPQPAPTEGGGTGDPSLDALMSGAVGEEQTAEVTPDASTPETTEQTLVYPLGLRALQRGNTQIVIFAAGDGDYGAAFDGFYIERAE
jgi:hypothetical protein